MTLGVQYTASIYAKQGTQKIASILLGGAGSGGEWYIDNISVKLLAGNHASQPTTTKRPLLQTDGTYWWLEGDGVDDFMQTGNIDFSYTDKMTVWAGVRKVQNTMAAIGDCSSYLPDT